MVKFIHTADWHLGMRAYFLPDEARARFAQDRFDATQRIAALARDEGCAFVVVAGDIFDSNHVHPQVIAKATEALSSFTVPVFLLAGNHDPLDPSSVFRTTAWTQHRPANAVVLEGTAAISAGDARIEVVGSPWRTKRPLDEPLAACWNVAHPEDVDLRVVVGHGVLDELSPSADDPALIDATRVRDALGAGEAHYVALGDRHSATELVGTEGRARYSGTPVSTGYGEHDPNQALVVSLDAGACAVEPRPIGTWKFIRSSRDLSGEPDVQALAEWLEDISSKHTAVVELALRGTLSLADSAALEDVLEQGRLKFASLNSWNRRTDLLVAPDDDDFAKLDLSGYARQALEDLRGQAVVSGEEAVVARDALNLLYRLAR